MKGTHMLRGTKNSNKKLKRFTLFAPKIFACKLYCAKGSITLYFQNCHHEMTIT